MFKKSILTDERTQYDGLGHTYYTNIDCRAVYDTNPSLLKAYDNSKTISIFKDYKNELGYQGEAVLLEQMKCKVLPFSSDMDVLFALTDKSLKPVLDRHEWDNIDDGAVMVKLINELQKKSIYYSKLIDEDDELYSATVVKFLDKLRLKYRKLKKVTNSSQLLFKELIKHLQLLKAKELKKNKGMSNILVGFFREFTDLQIVFNIAKSVTIDISTPLFYLEKWKVMFIPQHHYTVSSFNSKKLNSGMHYNTCSNLTHNYNDKYKKLILYNTPFVTTRYIRKPYIDY